MEIVVGLLALASIVGILVSIIGMFSEKLRNAVGFADRSKARRWLLISFGVFVVALVMANATMEEEGGSTERTDTSPTSEPKEKPKFRFGRWEPVAGEEGEDHVREAQSGNWVTFAVVDTFKETEVGWFASHPVGDHGEVRFTCANGQHPSFMAFADNPVMQSIGAIFAESEQIVTRVEVNDAEAVVVIGRQPNLLFVVRPSSDNEELETYRRFREGSKARIRTEHGEERHTFILPLDGFREASDWVTGKCGWSDADVDPVPLEAEPPNPEEIGPEEQSSLVMSAFTEWLACLADNEDGAIQRAKCEPKWNKAIKLLTECVEDPGCTEKADEFFETEDGDTILVMIRMKSTLR